MCVIGVRVIRTGSGIPAHDGVGAGAAGKFFRRRHRRRHCCIFGKYNNPPSFSGFWPFPKGVFERKTKRKIETCFVGDYFQKRYQEMSTY